VVVRSHIRLSDETRLLASWYDDSNASVTLLNNAEQTEEYDLITPSMSWNSP